jgi:general stress protein YciG
MTNHNTGNRSRFSAPEPRPQQAPAPAERPPAPRRSFAQDPALVAEAGRKGGQSNPEPMRDPKHQ